MTSVDYLSKVVAKSEAGKFGFEGGGHLFLVGNYIPLGAHIYNLNHSIGMNPFYL